MIKNRLVALDDINYYTLVKKGALLELGSLSTNHS